MKMYKYDWIWDKNNASNYPLAKKQPLKIHETISVFAKSGRYNPQELVPCNKTKKRGSTAKHFGETSKLKNYNYQTYTNYPKSIIRFVKTKTDKKLHPTQKPVALLEYLIKTYTHEGETVLDNCMGSGSTGVACVNTNRNFIGMELNAEYFNISLKRIAEAQENKARS